jgi:hypothetical protein
MATQVQFRRGTATQNNNFTGAEGELSVNLSNYSLRLHDGVTSGGYEIARQDFTNTTFGATVLPALNTTYNLGSSAFKFLNIHSQEFTGALTGNADTATALETARTINGVSFDGTADITIEASIDKTLFISEGLEDSGGLTSFDGGTDVTLRLKNAPNFSNNTVLRWDDTNTQFVDSNITDDGTTVTISGNLNVTGSTTTISTTNLEVTDKLIIIGDGTTTTQAADGAGFNIGTSGVSLTYDLANTSWTSSESWNLATGKTYKIAGNTVIGSTSLGSGIVGSSLTSVGTLTSLDVSGATTLDTLEVTNASTFRNNVSIIDGISVNFGASNDLSIYHTGAGSNIKENGTGNLNVWGDDIVFWNSAGTEVKAGFVTDGKVDLYYNNSKKFETTTDGVYITGESQTDKSVYRDSSNGTNVSEVDIIHLDNLSANTYTLDTWSYTTYAACEYLISCVNATAGEQQYSRVTIMATSSGDRYLTESNGLYTDSASELFEVGAASQSGNILANFTTSVANSDNDFRIQVTRIYR